MLYNSAKHVDILTSVLIMKQLIQYDWDIVVDIYIHLIHYCIRKI